MKDADINYLKSCGYFSPQRDRMSKPQAKTYLATEYVSDFPVLWTNAHGRVKVQDFSELP
jgi:hypothetical protein